MVVTVVVTGVPRLMPLTELAVEFNKVFEDVELGEFFIRNIVMSNNNKKRQVALDFETGFDAMSVQEKLDGLELLTTGGSHQVIKAKIMNPSNRPEPSINQQLNYTTNRNTNYDPLVEHVNEPYDRDLDEYETLEICKSRKRKRSRSTDSSKSHDKHRSIIDNKRLKSRTPKDKLAIENKKSSRKTKSPEPPKSHEKSIISYKKQSGSGSSRKSISAYCKERHENKTSRESNSSKPRIKSRRDDRSKSRKRQRSPSSILETNQRKSITREKYNAVETKETYKALTERKISKSKSKHDIAEQNILGSKSSKQYRSSSPYKTDTRSNIKNFGRKALRKSRSGTPYKLESTDEANSSSKSKSDKSMKKSGTKSKYYDDVSSDSECNTPAILNDHKQISKVTKTRRPPNHTNLNGNAMIESKKRQAIEDVIFEMELLLRQRKNTISKADKTFLTKLVKETVKSRVQMLEIHHEMSVGDIVTRYRSRYSKDNDMTLLRNLSGECINDGAGESNVLPDQDSQQDDIWTAVAEVLDGVDIDLLQAEPESYDDEVNEDPKMESQCCAEINTAKTNSTITSNDIKLDENNSEVKTNVNTIYNCVPDGLKTPTVKDYETNDNTMNLDLNSDKNNVNDSIISPCLNLSDSLASLRNNDKSLTENTEVDVLNTSPETAFPIKARDNNINLHNILIMEKNVLTKDSGSVIDNTKQSNTSGTISMENDNDITVVLTNDTVKTEINYKQNKNYSYGKHLIKPIKEEILTIDEDNLKSTTISRTNLSSCIEQENFKIELSLTDDVDVVNGIKTHNECNMLLFDLGSIKREPQSSVTLTTDINHNKYDIPPDTTNVYATKQEPETAATDSYNLQTFIRSEDNEFAESKNMNFNNPKIIPTCIKQEHVVVNTGLRQLNDIENYEIMMPLPIKISSVKNENEAVNNDSKEHARNFEINGIEFNNMSETEKISTENNNLKPVGRHNSVNISKPEEIEAQSNKNEQDSRVNKTVLPRNPKFILPIRYIMRGLNKLIFNEFSEYKYMFHITRKVLHGRFKDLVKDKGYVRTKVIKKMYKNKYAHEKYIDFLNGIVAEIKVGKYDDVIKTVAIRQDKMEKEKAKLRSEETVCAD